jgi:ATP-dependent DNA helicase RecG
LARVHGDKSIDASDKERLNQLVDQRVLERIGRGQGVRYLLSRSFYEMAGKSGAHTRRRGSDRETKWT